MFEVYNDYFLITKIHQGQTIYAKAGSMVAYQGNIKFESKTLTGNGKGLLKNAMQTIVKGVAGEGMKLMTAIGEGNIYFADNASNILTIDMNKDGGKSWSSLTIEGDKVLAYTDDVKHTVKMSTFGTSSTKGIFTSQFEAIGRNAHIALLSKGKPLYLPTPCYVDPQALIGYTGPAPRLDKNNITWKTFVGKESGESFVLNFSTPGYFVIVQPSEELF